MKWFHLLFPGPGDDAGTVENSGHFRDAALALVAWVG